MKPTSSTCVSAHCRNLAWCIWCMQCSVSWQHSIMPWAAPMLLLRSASWLGCLGGDWCSLCPPCACRVCVCTAGGSAAERHRGGLQPGAVGQPQRSLPAAVPARRAVWLTTVDGTPLASSTSSTSDPFPFTFFCICKCVTLACNCDEFCNTELSLRFTTLNAAAPASASAPSEAAA